MENELYILWTNADPLTAHKMVFMYGHNGLLKGWWEKVTIIIWGATTKLTAENSGIQEKIRAMIKDGVRFSACRACAEQLGVIETLENMGIEVIYWGLPLTTLIKEKRNLLTV